MRLWNCRLERCQLEIIENTRFQAKYRYAKDGDYAREKSVLINSSGSRNETGAKKFPFYADAPRLKLFAE